MANSDAAFGLRPVKYLDGSPYNAAAGVKGLAWDTSTALAIGDPVVLSGTANAEGFPEYKRAAAVGPIDGVITGILSGVGLDENVILRDQARTIVATSSNAGASYVQIAVASANLLFEIQEDSVGNAVEIAEVGLHANIDQAAPDSVNGISKVELDSSSAAADTTGGLAVKIHSLVERTDNAVGTNAKWYVTSVKSTNHSFASSR